MACQAELIRSLGRARLVLMLIKLPLLFTASSSRESEIRAVGRKHFADGPINNSISVCYDVGRPKFEILRWAGSNDWRSSFPAESLGGPNVGGTSTSQDQPSISFRKNISFKCFGVKATFRSVTLPRCANPRVLVGRQTPEGRHAGFGSVIRP